MISVFLEKGIKILVTGLIALGLETEASDEGGRGHCKPYPWVELRFTEDSDSGKKLNKILDEYNNKHQLPWIMEKQIGGLFWLVPQNKNIDTSILHKEADRLGKFMHQKI